MSFKLFKIFLSNQFAFQEFFEGFKKGGKNIAKNILFMFLGLYLVAVFALMFLLFSINTYASLEFMGATEFFPVIASVLSFVIVFNFGIISVASSYYAGNGEEQFLSLPITAKDFFKAKFGVSFVTDAIIGIALFSFAMGYYGYKVGLLSNPLFYIGTLIFALTLTTFVIAFIYFIFVVLLYFIPCFRKRNILNGIASFFVILLAFAIGLSSGFLGGSAADTEARDAIIGNIGESLIGIMDKFPIFHFFSGAINGKIIPILVLSAIFVVIVFVLVPLMSKMYIKTFEGASDVKTKRLSKEKIDKVVKAETKKNSIFKALLIRDIKGVWREPVFFANGPLMSLLFPFIMVIVFFLPFFMEGGLSGVQEFASDLNIILHEAGGEKYEIVKYYVTFGLAAFTLFNSSMNMISATCFSREGKGFYTLKALPISHDIIIKAKFVHSVLYGAISCAITTIIYIVAYFVFQKPFSIRESVSMILVMWFIVLSITSFLNIIDMLFDTINPKLNWETPTAAMKQNLNSLFGMLVNFGAVIIYVALGIILGLFVKPTILLLVAVGALFLIITLPVGSAYFKYADKKITNL